VRIAALAIRRRAASISAALGALSVGMAGSAELDDRTSRSFDGERVHVLRRRDVLDGEPERLEESDLGAGPASRVGSSDDLAGLGDDVIGCDPALGDRQEYIAGFGESGFAAVDEQSRANDG